MKKIILEKYKLLNIILFLVSALTYLYISINLRMWSEGADAEYVYEKLVGIYHPLELASFWCAGILGVLLLLPSHIFKKWLFFVAPPILLTILFLVRGISVYANDPLNPLHPTRGEMTENGMILLSLVSALFIAGQYYSYYKLKKRSGK